MPLFALDVVRTELVAIATAVAAATALAAALETALAAATSAAATTAAEFPARGTVLARTRFVDDEVATFVRLAVKGVDGALTFVGAAHGDEPETAGTLGHSVHHQHGFRNGAILSEEFFKSPFRCLEGEVAYIEFHDCWIFVCFGAVAGNQANWGQKVFLNCGKA